MNGPTWSRSLRTLRWSANARTGGGAASRLTAPIHRRRRDPGRGRCVRGEVACRLVIDRRSIALRAGILRSAQDDEVPGSARAPAVMGGRQVRRPLVDRTDRPAEPSPPLPRMGRCVCCERGPEVQRREGVDVTGRHEAGPYEAMRARRLEVRQSLRWWTAGCLRGRGGPLPPRSRRRCPGQWWSSGP
jgi:hypothetical protein